MATQGVFCLFSVGTKKASIRSIWQLIRVALFIDRTEGRKKVMWSYRNIIRTKPKSDSGFYKYCSSQEINIKMESIGCHPDIETDQQYRVENLMDINKNGMFSSIQIFMSTVRYCLAVNISFLCKFFKFVAWLFVFLSSKWQYCIYD